MVRYDTLSRRHAKEQPPANMCDDKTDTTTTYNIPLPDLTSSFSCPDSDRCDTSDMHVHPPRRSSPAISRFCPTLGWMHLVQNVTYRPDVSVTLAAPIELTVPDLWTRAEDNLLVQTISTKIRLKTYNPDWNVFWNLVTEEIPGHLPQHMCI